MSMSAKPSGKMVGRVQPGVDGCNEFPVGFRSPHTRHWAGARKPAVFLALANRGDIERETNNANANRFPRRQDFEPVCLVERRPRGDPRAGRRRCDRFVHREARFPYDAHDAVWRRCSGSNLPVKRSASEQRTASSMATSVGDVTERRHLPTCARQGNPRLAAGDLRPARWARTSTNPSSRKLIPSIRQQLTMPSPNSI